MNNDYALISLCKSEEINEESLIKMIKEEMQNAVVDLITRLKRASEYKVNSLVNGK